jgi:hypothetical protein
MFEFVFAILCAAFTAGLLTAFRKQHLLKRRLDGLERDHNLLRDRVLVLTLNRVPAQVIESLSPEQSDGRPAAETARTEIHPPTPRTGACAQAGDLPTGPHQKSVHKPHHPPRGPKNEP